MKTGKHYIQVFIESEKDLPQNGEYLFFHDRNLKHLLWCCYSEKLKEDYVYTYDWYLVEQPQQIDKTFQTSPTKLDQQ